jgi:uncharacterized protein
MKFHLDRPAGANLFTGYGPGYVSINDQRFDTNVIVARGREVAAWDVAGFEALTAQHFEKLLELDPEVVIFGSGSSLRFPHPQLTRALAARSVGFEVMDTKAACRTYNILVAEDRQVVAALLI